MKKQFAFNLSFCFLLFDGFAHAAAATSLRRLGTSSQSIPNLLLSPKPFQTELTAFRLSAVGTPKKDTEGTFIRDNNNDPHWNYDLTFLVGKLVKESVEIKWRIQHVVSPHVGDENVAPEIYLYTAVTPEGNMDAIIESSTEYMVTHPAPNPNHKDVIKSVSLSLTGVESIDRFSMETIVQHEGTGEPNPDINPASPKGSPPPAEPSIVPPTDTFQQFPTQEPSPAPSATMSIDNLHVFVKSSMETFNLEVKGGEITKGNPATIERKGRVLHWDFLLVLFIDIGGDVQHVNAPHKDDTLIGSQLEFSGRINVDALGKHQVTNIEKKCENHPGIYFPWDVPYHQDCIDSASIAFTASESDGSGDLTSFEIFLTANHKTVGPTDNPTVSNQPSESSLPTPSPPLAPTDRTPSATPTDSPKPSPRPSASPTLTPPSAPPTEDPDVNLLVAYLNKEGRAKITAVLDSFSISLTKIFDVISEISYNLDSIDFNQFSLSEMLTRIGVPPNLVEEIKDVLNADDNIASVGLDPIREIPPEVPIVTRKLKDALLPLGNILPPGIETVQANALWDIDFVEKIGVCVVDTGYFSGHPDLPSGDNVGGTTVVPSYGEWSTDDHGHGTHCAGTIGAITNNGIGVDSCMGDGDNFFFHIGKGLYDNGSGSSSSVMAAIRGCKNAGAKVISLSLGGSGATAQEEEFYRSKFEDEGILLIAAAGNDGNTAKSFPASYGSVMSVAAMEPEATFSQRNNQVEISAPGYRVLSTYKGNSYRTLAGTSMATPHVAGVAALVWSRFPQCTNVQIRNILAMTAKKIGDEEEYTVRHGYGLVQAKAAYDLLNSEGCEAADDFENPLIAGGCICCDCLRTSGCWPDPHFTAWDNSFYDFQGGCDVIAIDNEILQLQIRTRPRRGWSTITEVGLLIKASGQTFGYSVEDDSAVFNIDETTSQVRVDDSSSPNLKAYTIHFLNALNSFILVTSYGGNISLQVKGTGAIFSSSVGMLGSWDYGSVRFRNGRLFDTSGGWAGTRKRSFALANDWKVSSAAESLMKTHSDVCVDQRICGQHGPFACGDVRKLSQILPTCNQTCEALPDLDPTNITRSSCEEDIAITDGNFFTCQPAYQNPLVIESDPTSFEKKHCENTEEEQCFDNGCSAAKSKGYCDEDCQCVDCDYPRFLIPGFGCICFPGSALVEVEDRGNVELRDIQLGDKILVANGVYEPVYSFAHYDPLTTQTFVKLVLNSGEELSLSRSHMIMTKNKGVVPASLIEIGDELINSFKETVQVNSISTIDDQGMFAPFTKSGTLVVNGILVSNYVALQESPIFMIGNMKTPFTHQWLAHAFNAPHRFYCNYISDCTKERYTKSGLSTWVDWPFYVSTWVLRQSLVILIPCSMLLLIAVMCLGLFDHPFTFFTLAVGVYYYRKTVKHHS